MDRARPSRRLASFLRAAFDQALAVLEGLIERALLRGQGFKLQKAEHLFQPGVDPDGRVDDLHERVGSPDCLALRKNAE